MLLWKALTYCSLSSSTPSSDRLKNKGDKAGYVASLEGADVLFAVKQHSGDKKNYIIKDKKGSLYVDDADVMAVKQSDIPDINNGDDNDTKTAKLVESNKDTWLGNSFDGKYIAEVGKDNKASAAILGVENFNKFNDAR